MLKSSMLAGAAVLALAPAALAADYVTTVGTGDVTTTPHALNAPLATDTHTFNNAGTVRGASATNQTTVVLTAAGAGDVVINNNGRIQGRVDFSALTGDATFNNYTSGAAGSWAVGSNAANPVHFGAGDDTVNNVAGAAVTGALTGSFGAGTDRITNAGSWTTSIFSVTGLEVISNSGTWTSSSSLVAPDLEVLENSGVMIVRTLTLASAETLTNSGVLSLGAASNDVATLTGLQSFNNSGLIVLGGGGTTSSNGLAGTRIMAPGADFVGSGASRIALDATLGLIEQDSCPQSATVLADCLNLAGGSTSGRTLLTITGVETAEGGGFNPAGVTLVDVSGGQSDASHFVLDPNSPGYSAEAPFGGAILAANGTPYSLFYDSATQTHRLVGLPGAEVLELSALSSAVQELWRIGDEAGYARQSELRGHNTGGGLWAKVTGGNAERDVNSTLTVFGLSDTVGSRYEQESLAAVFGGDIVGEGYVAGVSVGRIQSRIDVGAGASEYDLKGLAVSVYGGLRMGDLYLDASASGYAGSMKADATTVVSEVDGDASAFGGRVEAAWRFDLGSGFVIEPLASVTYVQSSLGDIALPGDKLNAVDFGKGKSLRGGVGARAAYVADLGDLALDLSLTGRGWKELEGENPAMLVGRGGRMGLSETFDGDFTELSGAATITALDGLVSGFASIGGRFGDDYESASATLGVRYNW